MLPLPPCCDWCHAWDVLSCLPAMLGLYVFVGLLPGLSLCVYIGGVRPLCISVAVYILPCLLACLVLLCGGLIERWLGRAPTHPALAGRPIVVQPSSAM